MSGQNVDGRENVDGRVGILDLRGEEARRDVAGELSSNQRRLMFVWSPGTGEDCGRTRWELGGGCNCGSGQGGGGGRRGDGGMTLWWGLMDVGDSDGLAYVR